jgi:hypothetical protein
MQKKQIREKLAGIADSIRFKRDGSIEAKHGYFYTHGYTEGKMAAGIKAIFPSTEILSSTNHWAAWPRDSYFYVRFRLL